jgi:type III pantothenate kinase
LTNEYLFLLFYCDTVCLLIFIKKSIDDFKNLNIVKENIWLALMVGNSRLHWALFINDTLDFAWNTEHQPESVIQQMAQSLTLDDLPPEIFPPNHRSRGDGGENSSLSPSSPHPPIPLILASVVPSQTELWQTYPHVRVITLDQIPLKGLYPTLGIDRALALWGAGMTWGFPMLVIDAGTALTFTGADTHQCLVGGAILPGLGLQFATLNQKTGQLPQVETRIWTGLRPAALTSPCPNASPLPPHFALNTSEAIQSGVIYTLLAGIKDFVTAWWELFPESNVVITGGDRLLLINYLEALDNAIAKRITVEPNLIFWGIRKIIMGHH